MGTQKAAARKSAAETEPEQPPIHVGRFAGAVRPLTDDERQRLHASLERHGQRSPILVAADGEIIDGHHRYQWCVANGVEPIVQVDAALDDDEAKRREVAVDLNEARRQLSPEEIRERHRALRSEGRSIRDIAEETGSSKSTVARHLATVPPGTVEPERIVGRDGKSRPARQSPRGVGAGAHGYARAPGHHRRRAQLGRRLA